MSKPKRNVSGNALLRRSQFLTTSGADDESPPPTETPLATPETREIEPPSPPEALNPEESPAPPAEDTHDAAAVAPPVTSGLTKKQLLSQYLDAKNDQLETDLIYFPKELYAAFRSVWYDRKKEQRGYKKSNVIIEALLRHPDILNELQRQGLLKS